MYQLYSLGVGAPKPLKNSFRKLSTPYIMEEKALNSDNTKISMKIFVKPLFRLF